MCERERERESVCTHTHIKEKEAGMDRGREAGREEAERERDSPKIRVGVIVVPNREQLLVSWAERERAMSRRSRRKGFFKAKSDEEGARVSRVSSYI